MKPFLKWVGGKRRSAAAVATQLPPGRYHEPFLGGGAVFWYLIGQGRPLAGARLSDANERLIRTWRAVRDEPEQTVAALEARVQAYTREGAPYYYMARAEHPDRWSADYRVAAWLLFLNRTAFNGLYRVNAAGTVNAPHNAGARLGAICRPEAILAASRALQGVEIEVGDFRTVLGTVGRGDVVYLDSPYVPVSKTATFTAYTASGFGPRDQAELATLARAAAQRGTIVVLSNADTPVVRDLYAGWEIRVLRVPRAISCKGARRGPVGELLITWPGARP